jgi:hypothetical protein
MTEDLNPLSKVEYNEELAGRVRAGSHGKNIVIQNKEIVFEFTLTEPLYYASGVSVGDLTFRNCHFKEKVTIGDYQRAGHVFFENVTFAADVQFASFGTITLNGVTTFLQSATIHMNGSTEIEYINIYGTLFIYGTYELNINKVNVEFEEQKGNIEILGANENVVIQDVIIRDCDMRRNASREITLNRAKLFLFNFGTLTGTPAILKCSNSDIGQIISYERQSEGGEMEISNKSKIGRMVFKLNTFYSLECADSQFDHMEFFGENSMRHNIRMANIQLNTIVFRDMRNNGHISLNSLTFLGGGSLRMKLADMGKTDFILCDFHAGRFEFENSKITDVFMAESDFPEMVLSGDMQNFRQAQLAFGQISTAYQNQGDTVRALEYQAREIEAHYNALTWLPRGIRSFSFTKLSLWLNKCSNDFGRSWSRGISFSFAIGICLFYFLVNSSQEYSIGWGFHWDRRFVGSFLKFMNPLRFFETENLFRSGSDKPYLTLTPGSFILDFVSRFLIAYGFYQTIQAFRRYGRKN